jgi:fucose permease
MNNSASHASLRTIRLLTYLMFMMFAMTTDSVGVIIPEVIRTYHLSMTAGGAFHYASMSAIALAAVCLGFLADKIGRKQTIILGLLLFAINSFLFSFANSFFQFLMLLVISGAAIGIFKTGALSLIGDISSSTVQHTSTMNNVEGFFGIGAIIGPFLVAHLILQGVSWKWLYVIAGSLCVLLIFTAQRVQYPKDTTQSKERVDLLRTLHVACMPHALGFSAACFLYVAVECAIYVWLPTYIAFYAKTPGALPTHGTTAFLASYAVSVFFVLRAGGRFLGAWLLARMRWTHVLATFTLCTFLCFLGGILGGISATVLLLPVSGLFMSVIYPTLNSKGISCFPKNEHGAISGVILFFTCIGAVLGPLAMGSVSDIYGSPRYGFILATGLSGLLFLAMLFNLIFNPARAALQRSDESQYSTDYSL